MDDNKKAKAKPVQADSLGSDVYIKDTVLNMTGSKVNSRRPRKKGEGKDNSRKVFLNKKNVK